MKTIYTTLVLTFALLSCKAQIIPVEQLGNGLYDPENESINIPDGTYFKDVNNLLDEYVGTWIGTRDNFTYEFRIEKVTDEFLSIRTDELRLRYKITDAQGNVILDYLNLPDDSPFVVTGRFFQNPPVYYYMSYVGEDSGCGQMGQFIVEVKNNISIGSPILDVDFLPESILILTDDPNTTVDDEVIDCPNGYVAPIFPKGNFKLVKQ